MWSRTCRAWAATKVCRSASVCGVGRGHVRIDRHLRVDDDVGAAWEANNQIWCLSCAVARSTRIPSRRSRTGAACRRVRGCGAAEFRPTCRARWATAARGRGLRSSVAVVPARRRASEAARRRPGACLRGPGRHRPAASARGRVCRGRARAGRQPSAGTRPRILEGLARQRRERVAHVEFGLREQGRAGLSTARTAASRSASSRASCGHQCWRLQSHAMRTEAAPMATPDEE